MANRNLVFALLACMVALSCFDNTQALPPVEISSPAQGFYELTFDAAAMDHHCLDAGGRIVSLDSIDFGLDSSNPTGTAESPSLVRERVVKPGLFLVRDVHSNAASLAIIFTSTRVDKLGFSSLRPAFCVWPV